ncbi:MAG: toll/interleukin-1 receptor domain-containing protein [Methylococcales bacterium]
MANYISILKEGGVREWNIWRENHPDEIPDLVEADLKGMNLERINFSGCNLSRADLSDSNLHLANLGAYYDFKRSGRLHYWHSSWLEETSLTNTNLTQAVLIAYCDKTIFSKAICNYTRFVDIELLQNAIGLEDIIVTAQNSMCSIGIDTVLKSKGILPDAFLKKCGYLPPTQKSLYDLEYNLSENKKMVKKRSNFHSAFISCVEEDSSFAEKLQKSFQDLKIGNWFYRVHLLGGQRAQDQIDVGIQEKDRMIIIISKNMFEDNEYRFFKRGSVRKEILRAKEKEDLLRKQNQKTYRVIFPIMPDDAFIESKNDEIMFLRDNAWAVGFEKKSKTGTFKGDFMDLLDGLNL